jgi:Flp pilus assembly pilin Flp
MHDLSVSPIGPAERSSQHGQGMVEYAFILTLVALVVLTMLLTTGKMVISLFSNITITMHAAGL